MNGIYGRINSNQSIFLLYPKKGAGFHDLFTNDQMVKMVSWWYVRKAKNWSLKSIWTMILRFKIYHRKSIDSLESHWVNEIVDIFPNLQNNWLWYLSCWFHHFLLTFQARIFCWKNQLITFCFYAFISLHSVRVSALFGHEKNGTKRAERFVNRRY